MVQAKQLEVRRLLQFAERLLNLLQGRGGLQVNLLPDLLGIEMLREQLRKVRLRMRGQDREEKL